MADRPGKAVIFDVDGVLLELTRAGEELFFEPFERRYGLAGLSRDWDSYGIRNDDRIVDEILERHALPAAAKPALVDDYLSLLAARLRQGTIDSPAIEGAADLLAAVQGKVRLGIATANFRAAAQLRLAAGGLWDFVSDCAFGADGSGHKHETLARALAALDLPAEEVVYVGDNLNDVEAGRRNGVAFIGFSPDRARRDILAGAGAVHVCGDHRTTLAIIKSLLRLD
jgi:HAD superfamily hydrolase (TIGR01549 family)